MEAEIIFDFQTLVEMDSLLEDMDTTLDELNETTQDYLWLSYVQTQVLTSTDNWNTTVTFQDLQEEEIDPKDTDSPSLDPLLSEGYPPGPPLDPGGPNLVKYIQGQDIFTPWFCHLIMHEMTSKFLSILPRQMKCDVLDFKTVYSKHSLI